MKTSKHKSEYLPIMLNAKADSSCQIILCSKEADISKLPLLPWEKALLKGKEAKSRNQFISRTENKTNIIVFISVEEVNKTKEAARRAAANVLAEIKKLEISDVSIVNNTPQKEIGLAFAEGLALSNYQFLKYKTKKEHSCLEAINLMDKKATAADIDHLNIVLEATVLAKDLVNEPLSYLTAEQLSEEIKKAGKKAGFEVEVLDKKTMKKLGMGGVLSVNLGGNQPPTFSIMEWKPKNAKNKKPYVLVGKGIVYDTGGLSLKPTPNSMDKMKCDMAGAAAVTGAMYAIAKANLPLYVVALVPATENRPGEDAYVPGDVITLHNGKTVEVLNTDAEGRLVLGDALSYAQDYKPELVIDLATLTGAAAAAIGSVGSVMMGTAEEKVKTELKQAGFNVHERLAEFPFWEEYGEMIKSDVADIKNVGGPEGGSITAGKFLEHFIDYPWIHIDIAGPAFLTSPDTYRGKGATAVGVRLLFEFFKNKV
ncbi:MAG: leucyl aminopeptidase [Chitinophagales bacterium]|nr:leucyl aminopeptidase [Chitinophagales bacterium]